MEFNSGFKGLIEAAKEDHVKEKQDAP